MNKSALAGIAFWIVFSSSALAHGGGTDSNGCHTNRKTGDFHCHGSRAAAAPVTRIEAPRPQAAPVEIRRATSAELAAPRPVPQSFMPAPPPAAPESVLEVRQAPQDPGDGFQVTRARPSEMVQMAQLLLRAQKYEITDPLGELGYSTIVAIGQFQTRQGSRPDGRVSAQLLLRLIEAATSSCP